MKLKKIIYVFGILSLYCMASCGRQKIEETAVTSSATNDGESLEESVENKVTKKPTITSAPLKEKKGAELANVVDVVNGEDWKLGNLQGNLLNEGWICENEGELYYRDFNHDNFLCKMNSDGSGKQVLAEEIPRAIQVVGDWVYYIDDEKNGNLRGRIKRVSKNGGQVTVLGEDKAGYILVTEEGIFYSSGNIMKMDLEGGGRTIVQEYKGKADYAWLSIFGDCVFTEDVLTGKQLYAVKQDGSGKYLLAEGVLYPTVNGDSLWFAGKNGAITELSLVTGEEKVWNGAYGLRTVQYKDVVYYHSLEGIYVIRKEAKESEKIYPKDSERRHYIELFWVTSDRIYFCDYLTEESSTVTFQYMDLVTGELGIVP